MGNQKLTSMIAQLIIVEHPDLSPCSLVLFGEDFSLKVTITIDDVHYRRWAREVSRQREREFTLLPLGQQFSKA